jgi:hypothetical protein
MFATVPNPELWGFLAKAIGSWKFVERSSCHVMCPVPCSLGDLGGTAAGCNIGDRTDLKEEPAQIELAELVVSDSLLVEQWYQQLIVSSTQ